eukprot:COSAG06_NODE_1053_length_10949_cov_15.790968_15_plen_26_part_01
MATRAEVSAPRSHPRRVARLLRARKA